LHHVNDFREIALKESIVDVQLFKGPSAADSKTEYQADSCWLYNRVERLMIVHTGTLVEPFCNKSCLKSVYGTIRMSLNAVDPPATNNVRDTSRRNKFPRAIAD
jgi:hypothetical protein